MLYFTYDRSFILVRCVTGSDAVAERTGQRDFSSYRWSATRSDDVTTVCRLSRTDDVIAWSSRQQRNVETTRLRVRHQRPLVLLFVGRLKTEGQTHPAD